MNQWSLNQSNENFSNYDSLLGGLGEVSGRDCHCAPPGRNTVSCCKFTGLLKSDKE